MAMCIECLLFVVAYRLGIVHILLVSRSAGGTPSWNSFGRPGCGCNSLIVAVIVEAVTIHAGFMAHTASTLVSP